MSLGFDPRRRVDKRNKFGVAEEVDRTDRDGIVFASKAEMLRWEELKILANARQIFQLRRQHSWDLHAGEPRVVVTRYVDDFDYYLPCGTHIVEDVKGVRTREYKIKKKMMAAEYGIDIHEVKPRQIRRR